MATRFSGSARGLAFTRPVQLENSRGWLVAAVAIVMISAWTYAKAGGYYNSLIPGFLVLSVVSVALVNAIPSAEIWKWSAPAKIALALAFVITTTSGSLEALRLLSMTHGDDSYFKVIEFARGLPGNVASPEDPSIGLLSKGRPGRSLYFELDNAARDGNWSGELPEPIAQELRLADWLIEVRSSYPSVISPAVLERSGWTRVEMSGVEKSVYVLWKRTPPR